MRVTLASIAVLAAVVLWGIPAQAHHSIAMFDLTAPIWVKGAFVRLDRINPHSVMTLEERKTSGTVQQWAIEGPSARARSLTGLGPDALKVGDVSGEGGSSPSFSRARRDR